MKHGFIKVAAVTPKVKVADTIFNREQICQGIEKAMGEGAKVLVFPELCISAYTCEDLFLQERLLSSCKEQLIRIAEFTKGKDALVFVGLPFEREGKLYNVAAAVCDGEVLCMIPKTFIPSYGEFYETRHFRAGNKKAVWVNFNGKEIPFGTNILLKGEGMEELLIGCEICEDIWAPDAPGISHAMAGATLLVNLSASNETVNKDTYREMLVRSASAKLIAGYIYCSSGEGESTQDLVFGGHNMIVENGSVLAKGERFENQTIIGDIDINKLRMERRRMNTFACGDCPDYQIVPFTLKKEETKLSRTFSGMPFVPENKDEKEKRCDEILSIQSMGLKKRLEHTGCKKVVIGVSGGLDSTLALLVSARTLDMLEIHRENIIAVTMPCFGTTDRTYENACKLTEILGAALKEVDIREAVSVHFRDIGQSMDNHDVTYENSQARERTQILMDIANQENGMVIGTGDMSELALGWATYNGDHMSMYGVNAGVPKTLVRHLVRYYADTCGNDKLKGILLDVLDTPVSPELLPPVDGVISQKTEDLVGPYELHDYFLYYMLRCGFEPEKIFRIARLSFAGQYEDGVILKWMKTFYKRFFSQQFKRSCLPDGPKVGSVAVSPRGDLRMPSDACVRVWMEQLEGL
ncbi:NAD(+) synthase [Parablautia muri]|uniref:Glutamine-dependent NAD(+) synthetase n=1 Tax=Parablautia muri TaxID=2320879 RepID=A0A9X5BF23_9FIRM|nr:NAD(+) synthase [Parablautia muri]NBJ92585.1 NAD(+) synthase [Parablautia muri]